MKTAALGELATIVSGATPKTGVPEFWDGEVEWATPADLSKLDGPYLSTTPRKLTEAGVRSCATTVLPAGSVLLSSRAPIGHVAINTVPMATNQGFKSLVPGPNLDSKYLYHWLKSKTSYLQSLGNGATFKELSKKTTEQIEIPLPALSEQRRIAAILDHADTLRAKRSDAVALLDMLPDATFQQLFGNRSDQAVRLDALIDRDDRMNYGVVQPGEHREDGIPMVRVMDLVDGRIDRSNLKRVSREVDEAHRRSRLRGSEILISSVGTLGRIALASSSDVGMNINRAITRVPISDPTLRAYVAGYLRTDTPQRYFRREARTVAQATLNVREVAALAVPVPPKELQHRFVERLAQIDAQRARMRRAQALDNELFASLQSRAFQGTL